ncbi:MAG: formate dehydrogenase subunit gamma [Desulfobulbaceae bacterium]|nr:formate dehydrogenase subunit gamma [Desulfobulbaceae bacterium]
MQKFLRSVFLLAVFLVAGVATFIFAQEGQVLSNLSEGSSSDYYHALIGTIAGDWQGYGQLFTTLQGQWFWKVFLIIITVVPGVFLLHYLIIGAKHFDPDGEQILFFPFFTRVVHFFAAVSFSLLALTGLMMVLGSYLGGGSLIRIARYVHIGAAMVFIFPAVLMLLMWCKDMLPQLHDISWMFMLGGYLSKEKKPVPAGKYNAGQKMYFWFATVGGVVMAYTGYIIWGMTTTALDTVRLYTIIHNILGMAILAFYLTHVYMAVFAITGSLNSMKTGYKPKEEVDILHSRYKY